MIVITKPLLGGNNELLQFLFQIIYSAGTFVVCWGVVYFYVLESSWRFPVLIIVLTVETLLTFVYRTPVLTYVTSICTTQVLSVASTQTWALSSSLFFTLVSQIGIRWSYSKDLVFKDSLCAIDRLRSR